MGSADSFGKKYCFTDCGRMNRKIKQVKTESKITPGIEKRKSKENGTILSIRSNIQVFLKQNLWADNDENRHRTRKPHPVAEWRIET